MSDVTLTVAGKDFSGFESLSINRMLEACADTFSLTCPNTAEIKKYFKPYEYQECILKIKDEVIITGNVYLISNQLSQDSREKNIQGASKTAILSQCSIPASSGYSFRGLYLSSIAVKVCDPLGIFVNAFNDIAIKEANAEPGQTPFEFLSGLAASTGIIVTNDSFGRLLLLTPNKDADVIDKIIEGESRNLISASIECDGTGRFSEYQLMAQQDSSHKITKTAYDNYIGVKKFRPVITVGSEADGKDFTKSVFFKMAVAFSNSFSINVSVKGWDSADGSIYRPGENIILKIPSIDIDVETKLMIAETSLTLSKTEGKLCQMRLIYPSVYSGILPDRMPWEF